MGAPSKRAKKVRPASDFDVVRLAAELRPPIQSSGYYSWDLDSIRAAREQQMAGRFAEPARLAASTRTDYAIFASFLNRLAPQRGLPIKLVPPNESARAARVLTEADALFGARGIGIHPDTLTDIDGTLCNHGVAFGVNVVTPRDDGSRVDIEHKTWPIEFVRWDPTGRAFFAMTSDGYREERICHGDGRWTVYREHEHEPWTHGAILSAAMVWADHAFGVRDRSRASTSHGNAKIVGTMPQGVALQDANGNLTAEAMAFLELLKAVGSLDTPVGIKPFGSLVDYITNNSRAWEIFKEIISSGERAADRIYLGHDVSVPAAGGDAVGYLFGVRNDIIEGSLKAIQRGLREGVLEPWAAINFGDSSLAPDRVYQMPDVDEDARRKSLGERTKSFFDAVESAKRNSFEISDTYLQQLADDYGVLKPTLPASNARAPSITLAPTDIAKVVKVNEARASANLPPLADVNGVPDPDGFLTVAEFAAKKEAQSKASIPPPNGVATPIASPPHPPTKSTNGVAPPPSTIQ